MNKQHSIDILMSKIRLCPDCNLDNMKSTIANNFLPGKGNLNANIVFVGIAPTSHRTTGDLFTNNLNKTDDALIQALEFNLISRDDVYVTNISKGSVKNNRELTQNEIDHLSTHLSEEIDIIQPKLVIFMGSVFKLSDLETVLSPEIAIDKMPHPAATHYGMSQFALNTRLHAILYTHRVKLNSNSNQSKLSNWG